MNRVPYSTPGMEDLDAAVLAQLQTAGPAIGDGIAPPDAGWNGQPGVAQFVPYAVLGYGQAQMNTANRSGGMDPATMWAVGYQLKSVGGSRAQARWVGDKVRQVLWSWHATLTLAGQDWSLQQVQFAQLGGPTPDMATEPKYWESADAFSLWLSR